jgi:hypothetical protein
MTGNGTVVASVVAGAAQDQDGAPNASQASTSTDNTVTFVDPSLFIETNGQFTLTDNGSQYLIAPLGGGTAVGVTSPFAGGATGPNSFAGWIDGAIQAEENGSGGYFLLWQGTSGSVLGNYSLWTLNSSGGFVSFVETPAAAITPALTNSYEAIFEADIDGDGDINDSGSLLALSLPLADVIEIEAIGTLTLSSDGSQYWIGGGGIEVGLTAPFGSGGPAGPNSYAGWSATQAEEDGAGGFYVLWEHTNGDSSLWTVDSSGAFVSFDETLAANVTPEKLAEYQAIFGS